MSPCDSPTCNLYVGTGTYITHIEGREVGGGVAVIVDDVVDLICWY